MNSDKEYLQYGQVDTCSHLECHKEEKNEMIF